MYEAEGDDPNDSYVTGLDETGREAYMAALTDDSTGCAITAESAARDQVRSFLQSLPAELAGAIDDYNLGTDPAFEQAIHAWADCMQDAGFTWQTRPDMYDEMNAAVDGRTPSAGDVERERAAATADWDCDQAHIEPVRRAFRDHIIDSAENVEAPEWF